jgi:lipopolysaccharide export system protein LptA
MTPILHSGRKEEIVPETFIVIDSDLLQISQSQEEFLFNFSQNVEVKGVDFRLTCDHLKMHGEGGIAMVAMEQKISHHHLRSIRALGHVFLEQDDCFASANLMELFPEEGVIIFSGDAKLRDEKGTLCAEKFILRNGERRILVENDGTERSRVTIDIN